MKRLHVLSFGCQMNVYDGELMESAFCRAGYERAADAADADVAVRGATHFIRNRAQGTLNHRVVELTAHEALDREDRVLWVGDGLASGNLPNQTLVAAWIDRDNRRRYSIAFRVLEYDRLACL